MSATGATAPISGLGPSSAAAAPAEPASGPAPLPQPKPRSKWVFSLLPKSLQRHPSLDFHVITELTPAGRRIAPPTARHPAYYLEQVGKFRQFGNNTPAGEHPPPVPLLEHAMQRALASANYRPATPRSPLPSVVVVFNYGSFARFSTAMADLQQSLALDQLNQGSDPNSAPESPIISGGGDRDAESLLPMVLSNPQDRTDVLQRAELIGGEKFAHALAKAINDEAIYEQANGGGSFMGMPDASSPFHRFLNENDTVMDLVEESFSSCYFVVASAYDYRAMREGRHVLLWRTKMTVNSIGISMTESLPSLVVTAGPYLGREMPGPVTLTERINREGKVEVGKPRVVEYLDSSTPTRSARKR